MKSQDLLLHREFTDQRTGQEVIVRITHPITAKDSAGNEVAICYVHISGLDDGICIPVTQAEPFDAILGAAGIAHHRLALHEEYLSIDGLMGSSMFPRILPEFASKRALERIDAVLQEEEPKKFVRLPPGSN